MKKVLLTTTAMTFAASMASAGDMAMSGSIALTYGAFGTGSAAGGTDDFTSEANLNTQTSKIIETGEHTDEDKRFTSAVFFLNSCNGYCKIDNKKIKSEDNKMVIFNSNKKHTGSTCTDVDRRMLINFVYIKNN